MVDKACTKGGKSGTHVRPLQALNLVHDGCERVSADILGCVDLHYHAQCCPTFMRRFMACNQTLLLQPVSAKWEALTMVLTSM